MTSEKQQLFLDRFPDLYKGRTLPNGKVMKFSFEIADGWFDLVWNLSEKLESLAKQYNSPIAQAAQVKEKFAGLRFYIEPLSSAMDSPTDYYNAVYAAINEAERKSLTICELCGAPGREKTKTGGSWIRTVCEKEDW